MQPTHPSKRQERAECSSSDVSVSPLPIISAHSPLLNQEGSKGPGKGLVLFNMLTGRALPALPLLVPPTSLDIKGGARNSDMVP